MSLFAVQGVAATRRLAPDHAIQTRRRQEAEQQAAQAVVDADKKTLLMVRSACRVGSRHRCPPLYPALSPCTSHGHAIALLIATA